VDFQFELGITRTTTIGNPSTHVQVLYQNFHKRVIHLPISLVDDLVEHQSGEHDTFVKEDVTTYERYRRDTRGGPRDRDRKRWDSDKTYTHTSAQ